MKILLRKIARDPLTGVVILLLIKACLLAQIQLVAGIAAVIRSLGIEAMKYFRDTKWYWPITTTSYVCNIVVDATTVPFVLGSIGIPMILAPAVVIILLGAFIWTIDRLVAHRYPILQIEWAIIWFGWIVSTEPEQIKIKTTEPLVEIFKSGSVILYNTA